MAKETLDNTLGAAFLGTAATCVLFGITLVQTHFYYIHYPKDWQFQKISVGILVTLGTLHLTFVLHSVYHYLVTNFGNPKGLLPIVWSFKLQVVFSVLVITFVQTLYVLRVWKFGNHFSRFWPALLGIIVGGGYALGIFLLVRSYETRSFADLDLIRSPLYATYIAATSIDVAIATAMCYYLNRSRSSFVETNNKILIVMRYVLISGFLTSACSLSGLIVYATMPHNMIFMCIAFLTPNLYLNSYIAMLNARRSMNGPEQSSIDVSKFIGARPGSTLQTDSTNLHSMDDMNGIAKRFTASFPTNKSDLEQAIPSTHFGISVQETKERQYTS